MRTALPTPAVFGCSWRGQSAQVCWSRGNSFRKFRKRVHYATGVSFWSGQVHFELVPGRAALRHIHHSVEIRRAREGHHFAGGSLGDPEWRRLGDPEWRRPERNRASSIRRSHASKGGLDFPPCRPPLRPAPDWFNRLNQRLGAPNAEMCLDVRASSCEMNRCFTATQLVLEPGPAPAPQPSQGPR